MKTQSFVNSVGSTGSRLRKFGQVHELKTPSHSAVADFVTDVIAH